jgi:2,4-dienoyl-CoA reductase-like NADH-dependent reductase (Old Yellow Enzyme family)
MPVHPLFRPFTFRSGAVAKNRIALAPLTNQQSAEDGRLLDEELLWLERRAAGGYSIVETCAAHVSRQGKGFPGQLGVFADELAPGLKRVAQAITQHDALGLVQLYHGGVRSPSKLTGLQPVSASSWNEESPGFEAPRPASEEEILGFIESFVAAAHRSHRTGFQGIELHGAHGYLLSQFLSATQNTRTDGWGSTLEGRARLIRTIAQRIRREIPAPFVVGVRLSPEDFFNARGIDIDETVQVAKWLADDGVDFIHVSLWNYTRNTRKHPETHALQLFRAALPADVPVVAAGAIWSREDAENCLALGADFIALGRAAIINPDWPLHVGEPEFTPTRGPVTSAQLRDTAVSERFVNYLRTFKGLVADEPRS